MKNKTAKDIMKTGVVTVKEDTVVTAAIRLMLENDISTLPVVDADDKLVGIMSEHDIINFTFSGDADDTKVSEAMTRQVTTYGPDTDLATLVNCCVTKRIRVVPIVADDKIIGVIGRRDIIRETLQFYQKL